MELFNSALLNDVSKVKEFLQFGNVNICDQNNNSLLHYAAKGNAMEVANLLIDNYINLNICNNEGETALFEAVKRNQIGFVKLLLRNNANLNIVNKNKECLFFIAIKKGNQVLIDLLNDYEDIDYKLVNNDEENILFYALKAYNNQLFIKIANKYKELIKQKNYFNTSLIMLAAKLNNEEIFDYLFNDETNLYECDKDNNNLIFIAARYSSYHICKKIIDRKPIIEGKNKYSEDIFDLLKLNSNCSSDLFNNYQLSTEYKQYLRRYPFHVAIITRNYDLLDYCFDNLKKEDAYGISLISLIRLLNDKNMNQFFKLATK